MNSRTKGNVGEREWAKWLRDNLGCADACRGQQHRGGPDSPDVRNGIPGTHCEVKRVERLNLEAAMEQAEDEAGEYEVPYVAHRKNRKPWNITIRAKDLLRLYFCLAHHQHEREQRAHARAREQQARDAFGNSGNSNE